MSNDIQFSQEKLGAWYTPIKMAEEHLEAFTDPALLFNKTILDPSSGSGHFIFAAMNIILKHQSEINLSNFYVIDINQSALDEMSEHLSVFKEEKESKGITFIGSVNYIQGDSLLIEWPVVDLIIGNPPYLGGHKIAKLWKSEYRDTINKESGLGKIADMCSYFVIKASKTSSKCLLIVTNSIVDPVNVNSLSIAEIKGISYACTNIKWGSDANVIVSVVGWGEESKLLNGKPVVFIHKTLTEFPVSSPLPIKANKPFTFKCGRKVGHKSLKVTREFLVKNIPSVIKYAVPHINGQEIQNMKSLKDVQYLILIENVEDDSEFKEDFKDYIKHIEQDIQSGKTVSITKPWEACCFPKEYGSFYLARPRTTSKNMFYFVSSRLDPNASLMVSPITKILPFGILSSTLHRLWAEEHGSFLKNDLRYTAPAIFDTFPFPQGPCPVLVEKIEQVSMEILERRTENRLVNGKSAAQGLASGEAEFIKKHLDPLILQLYQEDSVFGHLFNPESPLYSLKNINKANLKFLFGPNHFGNITASDYILFGQEINDEIRLEDGQENTES